MDSFILSTIQEPASWGDYGIIGLMFGSLIGIIILFIRTSTKQNTRHSDLVKSLLDDGREERSEMTNRWVKSSDKLSDAITELSHGLRGKNK